MNISIITRASGDICIKYNLTFVIFTTEYTLVYILNCNERLMQSCNITRLFVGFVKQVKNMLSVIITFYIKYSSIYIPELNTLFTNFNDNRLC